MEIINNPPSFSSTPGRSSSPSSLASTMVPVQQQTSTESIILRPYNYNYSYNYSHDYNYHDTGNGNDNDNEHDNSNTNANPNESHGQSHGPPPKKKLPTTFKRVSNWAKKHRISVPGLRVNRAGGRHRRHGQGHYHQPPHDREQQDDSFPSFSDRDRDRDRDRRRDRDGDGGWHDDETMTSSYAAFCDAFTTASSPSTTATTHYNNSNNKSRIISPGPETDDMTLSSVPLDENQNRDPGANKLSTPLPLPPPDVITPSLYMSSEMKSKPDNLDSGYEHGSGPNVKWKRWCSVLSCRWFSFSRR